MMAAVVWVVYFQLPVAYVCCQIVLSMNFSAERLTALKRKLSFQLATFSSFTCFLEYLSFSFVVKALVELYLSPAKSLFFSFNTRTDRQLFFPH